jgi:hypothetical protein
MMETCRRAGFVDVRLKPMSYVISGFDLTLDQWMAWSRLSRRKRPFRAAEKLWRATLELVGLGKRDQLFEEAFAMGLVRLLRGAMEDHPVVVASKSAPAIEAASRWAATIKPISPPIVTTAGEPVVVTVEVKNVGRPRRPRRDRVMCNLAFSCSTRTAG